MKKHDGHDPAVCTICEGDGEITSEGPRSFGEYAWCVACRGTGLVDTNCDVCGDHVTLDTKHGDAWTYGRVLVHKACETTAYRDAG